MNWLELHIDTNHSGLTVVETLLSSLGIDGVVIDDETEFQEFLEHNHQYWDYVDEELTQRMQGRSRITFYLEENEAGFAKLGEVRIALDQLKRRRSDCGTLLMTLENLQGSTFFPHTTLDGVDVGKLTASEAAQELEQTLPQRQCEFYLGTEKDRPADASITFEQLGIVPEGSYQSAAEQALRTQKDLGFFSRGFTYLKSLLGSDSGIVSSLSWEQAKLDTASADLASKLSRPAQDTSYQFDNSELQVTMALDGCQVTAAAVQDALKQAVKESEESSVRVELKPEVLPAKSLSAQELSDAVAGSMRNAWAPPSIWTPPRPPWTRPSPAKWSGSLPRSRNPLSRRRP